MCIFIIFYVKVNVNAAKLYIESSKNATISIVWTLYRCAYVKIQSLFEFASFQTCPCLIHGTYYLRPGKTGTCANNIIKQDNKELLFYQWNKCKRPSWTIFTWPLAGLYLNEKEGLKEGSMAAGFRGVEVCFAAAWLMPHLCFVEMGRKRLWWGCQWWEGSFDLLFWGTDQSLEEVSLQLSSGNLYFLSSTSVQATLKYTYRSVSFCLFKTLKNLF